MNNTFNKRKKYISKRRTKIKNKFRFTIFCIICFLTLFSLTGLFRGVTASKYQETFTLMVSDGDTLWEIAAENNPQNKDIRDVVDDIIQLNKINVSSLSAGDKIIIPVY